MIAPGARPDDENLASLSFQFDPLSHPAGWRSGVAQEMLPDRKSGLHES